MSRALTIALRGVFLAIVAVGLTTAAAPAQQPTQQEQQQDVEDVPEDELRTFAEAYAEIADIRRQMQSDLQEAENRDEATQIQQDADQEMQGILQENGISVERYQEITQILNADPEQRQEFEQILQEVRGEGA